MHLPDLIVDLALILLVASVTTVLFKKIRQPLVLGYIVAGFMTGPYFHVVPSVTDMSNITVWSDIGIICLMFTLGLEFSFHKLANVGGTAIITAVTEVCGMLFLGFLSGILLGWSMLDSIILGGILSMSSTTIIIKAFDELNMKGKKFTELVFGTLIIEDIVGIFMMVFLSTFALSVGASNSAIILTIVELLFYLVLWLILGIFIIPSLLKRAKYLMNDETLLIVSLGICFGVVLLFTHIGFSSALGAFIAGSILAGTIHAERIEGLVKPIKDLFGAVFFISVGMLVDPAILVQFAVPIVLLTVVTIIGKLFFSSLGVLLSGQRLKTAIYSGASLAQIGEFAFIIAALSISLKLSSAFIYPVIISVSVITTFTTPFCIKNAEKIYQFVNKLLPDAISQKLNRYTSDTQTELEQDSNWKKFFRTYFTGLLINTVVLLGVIQLCVSIISPFLTGLLPPIASKFLTVLIASLLMAPFLRTLLYQRNKNFSVLWIKNKSNQLPLVVFLVIRVTITIFLVMLMASRLLEIHIFWFSVPALLFIILLSRSDWLIGIYLQIEAHFLANFNEKQLSEHSIHTKGAPVHHWLSEQLWIGAYRLPQDFSESGSKLINMKWRKIFNVNVVKIISRKKHINIPDGEQKVYAGDIIFILGTKTQIDSFINATQSPNVVEEKSPTTLRNFIANQDNHHDEQDLLCYAIDIDKNFPFVGKSIKDSHIRSQWSCSLIGIQRGNYPIIEPDVQTVINNGDQIWVLGSQKMGSKLIQTGLVEDEG